MEVTKMSFQEGKKIKVALKLNDDCDSFSINIGHDMNDIALHVNPRFAANAIVCNNCSSAGWGEEEWHDESFPFARGAEMKFYVNFREEMFDITLPDGSMITFPNRAGSDKYDHLHISGDAKLVGFRCT